MCYQYNGEFRRDIKKDEAKEPHETTAHPQTRAEGPAFKFWAFPHRNRETTVKETAQADRARERV